MTIKALEQSIGGLSNPTKMPGLSYGIPAAACKVGSILRAAGKHTVCGSCYAHKGMYSFPVVQEAESKRLAILSNDLETWADNMAELIRFKYRKKTGKDRVFRWHDSGDLQSFEHLTAIASIAKTLPDIKFWLPTKEYQLVQKWTKIYNIPANLTIRISSPLIGARTPIPAGCVGSTVSHGGGHSCPAPQQGGNCGDCRACWNKSVKWVDYHKH